MNMLIVVYVCVNGVHNLECCVLSDCVLSELAHRCVRKFLEFYSV